MTAADDEDLQRAAELRLGSMLRSKCRLDELIGVGGMAAVYAATHRNGKRVAVKILHPHLALAPGLKRRFVQEGYAANTVGHPGVVEVLDDDVAETGETFVVMELLVGANLDTHQKRHGPQLPAPFVCSVTWQLLDILAAAHDKGILHRDVKPENVFVTDAGGVKLVDFGVARVREWSGKGGGTQAGTPIGTPQFMSPEQAIGKMEEIDARSDVFGVGALMFTLLAGRFMHVAQSPSEALVLAATRPAPPLRSVAPAVAPSVARVVDRALAFDRTQRWGSAAEMREAVGEAYREVASGAGEPSSAPPPRAVDGVAASQQRGAEPDGLSKQAAAFLSHEPEIDPEEYLTEPKIPRKKFEAARLSADRAGAAAAPEPKHRATTLSPPPLDALLGGGAAVAAPEAGSTPTAESRDAAARAALPGARVGEPIHVGSPAAGPIDPTQRDSGPLVAGPPVVPLTAVAAVSAVPSPALGPSSAVLAQPAPIRRTASLATPVPASSTLKRVAAIVPAGMFTPAHMAIAAFSAAVVLAVGVFVAVRSRQASSGPTATPATDGATAWTEPTAASPPPPSSPITGAGSAVDLAAEPEAGPEAAVATDGAAAGQPPSSSPPISPPPPAGGKKDAPVRVRPDAAAPAPPAPPAPSTEQPPKKTPPTPASKGADPKLGERPE